jgi:predicted phage terminase large subunit-like protein
MKKNNNDFEKLILNDPEGRRNAAKDNHFIFFVVYLNNYMKYDTAPFQREMFAITQDEKVKTAVIVSFRNSAKSTIMTLSYPLWAILGIQKKKFVVIISQTQNQAQLHFKNIKRELEANTLLKKELGPFEDQSREWGSYSIVIPKYNARINSVSRGESIRGIRHQEHRPDLIVLDDVEDLTSVRNKDSRDKTYEWLTSEVIPAGDRTTKIIIIGNLLHEDSLLMRLKKNIEEDKLDGLFRAYPLMNEKDAIAWPSKFPNLEEIEKEKKSVGSEVSFQREYMLKIIDTEEQLVKPEWIQRYEKLPGDLPETNYRYTATGVDPAISKKNSADFTAMVTAKVYGRNEKKQIYILPNPVNQRLDFGETRERIKLLAENIDGKSNHKIFVEDVGYQKSLIQELENESYLIKGFQPKGDDKRARLLVITHLIKNGTILFPEEGAEVLLDQLINFGAEKYDDLADAFAILINKINEEKDYEFRICFGPDDDDDDDNW